VPGEHDVAAGGIGTGDRLGDAAFVLVGVDVDRAHELPLVAEARRLGCRGAGFVQCRQDHGDQHGNHADDHEQFDQGKRRHLAAGGFAHRASAKDGPAARNSVPNMR